MYLVGASQPHKIAAQRLLNTAAENHERLVTNTEVLQEILHRYVAIARRDAIQVAFDLILQISDDVFSIELRDVLTAKDITLSQPKLSARDALHIATMHRNAVTRIMSFDAGFDSVPGITRLS